MKIDYEITHYIHSFTRVTHNSHNNKKEIIKVDKNKGTINC